MAEFVRQHASALALSTLLHVMLLAALGVSIRFEPRRVPIVPLAIEATVIDESALRAQRERERAAEQERQRAAEAREREARQRAEAERQAAAAEQRRLEQQRLIEVVRRQGEDLDEVCQAVFDAIENFTGGSPLRDDATVVVAELAG